MKRSHLRLLTSLLVIGVLGLAGCPPITPPAPLPTPRVKPEAPIRAPKGIEFEFAEKMKKVYFEFDKARLTAEARAILEENAAWLREHPEIKVQIEGHCDERGTAEYNLALGERRATSVRNYLISLGIDPARLYTISYGEERPVDRRHNEEAWAKNRRAEFKIAK